MEEGWGGERDRNINVKHKDWLLPPHVFPHWGLGPGDWTCNPGMCPGLEIESETLQSADWHSNHWKKLARAIIEHFLILFTTNSLPKEWLKQCWVAMCTFFSSFNRLFAFKRFSKIFVWAFQVERYYLVFTHVCVYSL